jgi:hypothetical protein
VAGLAGPDSEPDRQVCLAGPRRAQKNRVLLAADEVQCAQMCELLSRQTAQMGDVEFLKCLQSGEPCGADAGLAAMGVAGGDLTLQAGDQVFGVGPGLGVGALGQALGGVQQGRGLQGAGEEGQVGGGLPAGPGRVAVRLGSVGRGVRGRWRDPGHQVSSFAAPPSMRVNMRS